MKPALQRALVAALGYTYAAIPLFPAFIALAPNAFPGVSVVPRVVALAVLAVGVASVVVFLASLKFLPKRDANPLLWPMLSVFGAALLAALAGFNPFASLLFVCITGMAVAWHSAIVSFYASPGVARAIFWAYMVSGAVAAAAAIAMIVLRAPAAQYAIQHGRATGTFVLPGELAAYLVVLLPVAFALTRLAREGALRAAAWAALLLGAAALAMTYSRAGWMGCAAAAAFLLAAQTRALRQRAAVAVAVVGGVAVAILLLFNVHHNPSEDYTRLSIWQASAEIFNRFPLTGTGPFDFSRLYPIVRVPDGEPSAFHAHNTYLTVLAELGIIGAAAFLWTVWGFAREVRRRVAAATPPAAFLALAFTAGLVGVAVQGLIDVNSVVIFGLWFPTMALAIASARHGLGEPAA